MVHRSLLLDHGVRRSFDWERAVRGRAATIRSRVPQSVVNVGGQRGTQPGLRGVRPGGRAWRRPNFDEPTVVSDKINAFKTH